MNVAMTKAGEEKHIRWSHEMFQEPSSGGLPLLPPNTIASSYMAALIEEASSPPPSSAPVSSSSLPSLHTMYTFLYITLVLWRATFKPIASLPQPNPWPMRGETITARELSPVTIFPMFTSNGFTSFERSNSLEIGSSQSLQRWAPPRRILSILRAHLPLRTMLLTLRVRTTDWTSYQFRSPPNYVEGSDW